MEALVSQIQSMTALAAALIIGLGALAPLSVSPFWVASSSSPPLASRK